jgi:hypothetical protein
MCVMMNMFYGLKALMKNEPISFEGTDHYKPIREVVEPLMHTRQDAESGAAADRGRQHDFPWIPAAGGSRGG